MSTDAWNGQKFQLLLDEGAEISLLKYESLTPQKQKEIDRSKAVPFGGITAQDSHTYGKVSIQTKLGNHTYEFDFHVTLPNADIHLAYDGIFGKNLLNQSQALTDHANYKIHLRRCNYSMNLLREYQIAPKARSVITVATTPTNLKEGILNAPTIEDDNILLESGLSTIQNNSTKS